jgi:hypothetical protein
MGYTEVLYFDPYGNQIFTISNWLKLEYNRAESNFGSLYIDLPITYSIEDFKIDGTFQVVNYDDSGRGVIDGDTVWFIRLIRQKVDEQNKNTLHILAHDAVSILNRRIVAYHSASAFAGSTALPDDMIKLIVRQNFGSLATDTTRDISSFLLVDPDFNLCTTSLTKTYPWQKVLPLLQDICSEAKLNGEYLAFDVVKETNSTVRLKTYVGQRGSNHGSTSSRPLFFNLEGSTLSYASYAHDWSEEINYVYAGGQGEAAARTIKTASDYPRIAISPYNRIEDFIDARNDSTDDGVQGEASSRLREGLPRKAMSGHIRQTQSMIFGIDYKFGDIVVAQYGKYENDVHISSYSVVYQNGKRDVTMYSRNLDESEY